MSTKSTGRVAVVDDEENIRETVGFALRREGYRVDLFSDGQAAWARFEREMPDLVVLDIVMPRMDGLELCRKIRGVTEVLPIVFLTSRDEEFDRVLGLELGGDDYLVKPFAFAELLARVRALLRRGRTPPATAEVRVRDLVIDTNRRRVTRRGQLIALTMREYQLLEYLVQHAGTVATRTDLWEHVWDSHSVPDSNVVDVYIRYLRNKLGRAPDLIATVRGGGYLLEVPGGAVNETPHPEIRPASSKGTE